MLESEMTSVFGPIRGKSGYSFANLHDSKIMDKIQYLYLIVYGKEDLPKSKLIGKEFAKGIVVDVVKGMVVSWANFGYETNTNQRGKWQSWVDTLVANKAMMLCQTIPQVKKDLKLVDIVKLEKGVKAKIEVLALDKVTKISLWTMKKNEVANLLSVVGFELEADMAEIVNMNKDILCVASKVEQVKVVLDTMMTMKDE